MHIAFAAGDGCLATQSLLLSRSIRQYLDADYVTVFIPSEECSEIPDKVLNELHNHHHVVYGDIPIPDYPISSKIKALEIAESRSISGPKMLLDTDTLVLDNFQLKINVDVGAAPVDIATNRYWATDESEYEWKRLQDHFDLEDSSESVRTIVDKQEIRPYYNAGVVISTISDFGQTWLSWTRDIHNKIDSNVINADQIALGLLSQKYDFVSLDKLYNFPASYYYWFPSDIKILHYYQLPYLIRVFNPKVTSKLSEIGVLSEIEDHKTTRNLIMSGYGFKRPLKTRIGRALKRIWPDLPEII